MGGAGAEGTETETLQRKTIEMNPKTPKIPLPPPQEKTYPDRYTGQAQLPFTTSF